MAKPVPQKLLSGEGHSHTALPNDAPLNARCRADHERPVRQVPKRGYRSQGTPCQQESDVSQKGGAASSGHTDSQITRRDRFRPGDLACPELFRRRNLGTVAEGFRDILAFVIALFREEFLGFEGGHAAHAGAGHGLTIDMVGQVTSRENSGN